MIRNIIFDWSGTLVDDLPAVWQATNYVLAQAERPEMTLEQFRAEFCLPFTIFYDRHTPHVPLAQSNSVGGAKCSSSAKPRPITRSKAMARNPREDLSLRAFRRDAPTFCR